MRYLVCMVWLVILSIITPIRCAYVTCRLSQFTCKNDKCIQLDKYCDGVKDCEDASDEPKFCSVCNRTYHGDVGTTYKLTLKKPSERKLPFICHLTFTANGNSFGDIIQLGFEKFAVGLLEETLPENCPDGYMQILELGRPFVNGHWCGEASQVAFYYSESNTVTVTLKLFFTGRYSSLPFDFKLNYKFIENDEAETRYGTELQRKERGEFVPGSYCSRNFYECYRKKCKIQSPNYPGIYPRNITCHFRISQKIVPKCKHALISVRQTNRFKLQVKRSSLVDLSVRNTRHMSVWEECTEDKDYIIFYDGLTTNDPVLFKFCGGDWVPPILSRDSQMLVVFRSSHLSVPLYHNQNTSSLIRGFELDVDSVFADSDSYDFSRHKTRCEFLINATESDSENGANMRSRNRLGSISSPRHTLPPNTTCVYKFEGQQADKIWISIASYWHQPLLINHTDICPTRLRIWNADGTLLGDHCNKPKLCDHSAMRNYTRMMRACTPQESYISSNSSVIMQYYSKPGTAIHPSKFLIYYEFVDTELGGQSLELSKYDENNTYKGCSRIFKGIKSQDIRSPRNVFMFGRGGAEKMSCLYRIEANQNERIKLTFHNISFGTNSKCFTEYDVHTDRYVCTHSSSDDGHNKLTQLKIMEIPWNDVYLEKLCLCDNEIIERIPSKSLSIVSYSRILEIRFDVFYLNLTEDFFHVYFNAHFNIIRKGECPRNQRIRGGGGEIQFVHQPVRKPDIYCVGAPWLIEANDKHSLFLLTWGTVIPIKPPSDDVIRCNTKNRILIYYGAPLTLYRIICPSTPEQRDREIRIFSKEWNLTDDVLPLTPSFLVQFISKEPGVATLHWLEVTKPKSSFIRLIKSEIGQKIGNHSALRIEGDGDKDCFHHCPELNACISENLWCDGRNNCPSGYDELDSHCTFKIERLRNYLILFFTIVIIVTLTIFVLIATVRRIREPVVSDNNETERESYTPTTISTSSS